MGTGDIQLVSYGEEDKYIMGNPWMDHVKTISKANAGMSLKEILKLAKKSYKKRFAKAK